MSGREASPLTPAASWAPTRSSGDGGTALGVQRSKSSTFARLTRSVSKLGSGKARTRGGVEAPAHPSAAGASAAAASAARAQHRDGGPEALGRAPRGHDLNGTGGSAAGTGGSGMSLAARLRQFEEGRFDLEADLGSLTEKGVETLRGELGALDAEVGTQLRSAVGTHYADFVKATPGILRLEGEVQQLRNLLHTMGDVVEGLKEVSAAVSAQSATAASQAAAAQSRGLSSGGAGGRAAADVEAAWRAGGDGAKWLECLDDADVAVAERRLSDALALLRRLERLLSRFVAAADAGDPAQQARLDSLSGEVERRREALIAISEQQVLQPTAASPDICAGADLLGRLAGQPHALVTVLEAHAAKLKRHQAALLRPAASGGGDADGSDYAAALGQKLALALAAAADDLHCVFGSGAAPVGGSDGGGTGAELDAAFLVWALHQTERTCHLLRKHALLPFAAPAGLHAFCRCAFAFAAHAAALEGTHGLQLMPTVHRELWPVLEQVLARRVRKLGDALRKAAVAEVEAIAGGAVPPPADPSSWECLETTFPSANYFLDELEGMAAEGRRLASPRLLGALRKAVRRSQGWQALGAERG